MMFYSTSPALFVQRSNHIALSNNIHRAVFNNIKL